MNVFIFSGLTCFPFSSSRSIARNTFDSFFFAQAEF